MPRRLLLPLALVALLAAAAAAEAKPGPKLTVMTRNIYLGGNIALPIGATSREDFEAKTTQLWQQVQATDFPARAKLLAREIRRTKPDVIGLQEVALWRRGPDGVKDGAATPATTVGLRLPGHAARRAGLALPARQRPDRGRHRGADQPRLRRPAHDARRGARAQAQGPAHPPQARRQLRGRRSRSRPRSARSARGAAGRRSTARCAASASASSTRTWRRSTTRPGSPRRARSRPGRCARAAP